MRSFFILPLAGIVILAAVHAACGNRSEAPASPGAAQLSQPQQAAAKTNQTGRQMSRNACALIDKEEIEAIVGQPLFLLNEIVDEDQSTCEFYNQDNILVAWMTVHWRGGKELARSQQAALSMAKQFLNDEDVDIEELTGSGKVRGLADKAYYSDIMPSWVLKGDVMIEIMAPLLRYEQTKKVFLAATKKALARLPD